MSVTSGFFNSVNGDRKYNAEQMSAIFDGIINDGVLANIGTAFTVKYASGTTVEVGIGRAWFNSTWVYNDAILPLELDAAEVVLNRIDAVVIEIDRSDGVRKGDIKVIKGTPGAEPSRPTMASTAYVHQYPLAYIYRTADSTTFSQADITSMIGTSACPYVTGILQVQNIDNIVAQWQAQWIEWFAHETATTEGQADDIIAEWNQWYANQTSNSETEVYQWMTQMKADIEAWLAELQFILDDETATLLTSKITDMEAQFATLTKDRAIYSALQDNAGDKILDSYGNLIEGTTAFPYGSGTGGELHVDGLVTFPTFEEHVAKNAEEHADIRNQIASHDSRITAANTTATNAASSIAEHIANKSNPHGITPQSIGAYEPSVGDIQVTTRTNLGSSWLLCNGATVNRSSYPSLSPLIDASMQGPWVKQSIPNSSSPRELAYGNGYWVTAENKYDYAYYLRVYWKTSITGAWSYKDILSTNTGSSRNIYVHSVRYINGYFVIVGSWKTSTASGTYQTGIFYTNNPSGAWTQVNITTSNNASDQLYDIAYGGGRYVVCGTNNFDYHRIAYATSLSGPWAVIDLTASQFVEGYENKYLKRIIYANGYFVALGLNGSEGKTTILYTTNPTSAGAWSITSPFASDGNYVVPGDIIYANGKFLATTTHSGVSGWYPCGQLIEATVPSGPWISNPNFGVSSQKTMFTGLNRLLYANGLYVIATEDRGLMYSSNLYGSWFSYAPSDGEFTGICTDGTNFMALSDGSLDSGITYTDPNKMVLPSISLSGSGYTYIKVN